MGRDHLNATSWVGSTGSGGGDVALQAALAKVVG